MTRTPALVTVALTLALAGGCDRGGTAPVSGEATLELATDHVDLAALTFTARTTGGTRITGLEAVRTGHGLHFRVVGDTLVHGAIFGDITAGPLVRVGVSDTRRLERLTATVTELAGLDYELRPITGVTLAPAR
jgi:hypothetical protein